MFGISASKNGKKCIFLVEKKFMKFFDKKITSEVAYAVIENDALRTYISSADKYNVFPIIDFLLNESSE